MPTPRSAYIGHAAADANAGQPTPRRPAAPQNRPDRARVIALLRDHEIDRIGEWAHATFPSYAEAEQEAEIARLVAEYGDQAEDAAREIATTSPR